MQFSSCIVATICELVIYTLHSSPCISWLFVVSQKHQVAECRLTDKLCNINMHSMVNGFPFFSFTKFSVAS